MRECRLTFMRWSTRASSCVFMDSLQYSLSPGVATSRMANSLWNINTAHLNIFKHKLSAESSTWTYEGHRLKTLVVSYLKKGRCSRSLKTNGDEICTSKERHVWDKCFWVTLNQLCAEWRTHVFTWYGKLATQTSKKGRSVFRTSPTNIWSLLCMGLLENTTSFC